MRFASVEFAAAVVVVAVELIAWAYLLTHRRWLHRARALLARKPHPTRRAHTIRQLVFNLEMLWIWTPGVAAMIIAALLGLYVVDIDVWPDAVGVAVFLGTGASVLVGNPPYEAHSLVGAPLPCLRSPVGGGARLPVCEGGPLSGMHHRPVRSSV